MPTGWVASGCCLRTASFRGSNGSGDVRRGRSVRWRRGRGSGFGARGFEQQRVGLEAREVGGQGQGVVTWNEHLRGAVRAASGEENRIRRRCRCVGAHLVEETVW